MKSLILILLAAFLFIAPPISAAPEGLVCVSHDDWEESLYMGYQENVIGAGMTAGGIFMELFASPGGETWTVLITYPAGLTCGFASGEGWTTIDPPPDGPEKLMEDEGAI